MQAQKPKLLYIVHCYHNRAGVEEHIRTLSASLRDTYQISIAFPENGAIWLLRDEESPLQFPAEQLSITAPYRAPNMERSLAQIFDLVSPDLIHMVHFVNWPLSVIDQCLASGKPLIMSFHEYYTITPYYTMQGTEDPCDTLSSEYAISHFGNDISEYLKKRREVITQSLSKVQHLVVPSPYLQRQMQQVFPFDFQIIEYGINPFTPLDVDKDWPELRFGYLGSLLPQKGWDTLLHAFLAVREKHQTTCLRFYGGDDKLPEPVPGVSFHGMYDQADIPGILSEINVGIIPSVFAETYSLILSEMWQGGVIAAVADIGAMGERIVDGINGKIFPPGNVQAISDTLLWFLENGSWKEWEIPKPHLVDAMRSEYDKLYRKALS